MRVVGACTCTRSVFESEIEGKCEAVHPVHGLPHHFYCVCEYVLSCPVSVLVLVFFLGGGWCELVCVCTWERGGFLFGVGVLVVINPWVGCHVQVCVRLYDALFCISMPA